MTTRTQRHLTNWLLALGAILATLVFAEIALRVRALSTHSQTLAEALAETRHPPTGANVTLGEMIRISANPTIVYELRPNLDVVYKGARVTTDERGFRVPSATMPEHEDDYLVVGIGDSVMFGQAIEGEETYLHRLQTALEQTAPRPSWRTINTAVPGYNTAMEVETLKAKALALKPDLVLIDLVDNDFSLPNFIPTPELRPDSGRSLILGYLLRLRQSGSDPLYLGPTDADAYGAFDPRGLMPTPATGSGAAGFADRPELAPPQYADLVGTDAVRRSLRTLRDLASQHAFELAAISMHVQDTAGKLELKRIVDDLQIPFIDAGAAIRRYIRAHQVPLGPGSRLRASPDDAHPSALSHEIATAEILHSLRRWKMVPSPS